MSERPAAALLLLLAAGLAGPDEERRPGIVARLASRATGAVTDIVDPDAVLGKIDVDALVRRIDVDALLARVDVNALMARVDVEALLERVDVNALMARVDVEALLERVDPNGVVERVDVDRLMDRMDVGRLVERAGIPEIVRESTGHVAGSVLDAGRRQVVGLDELVGRVAYRITGRDPDERPVAPPTLLVDRPPLDRRGRARVGGHYAGPLSRFLAYVVDVGVVMGVYTLIAAGVTFTARFLFGIESIDDPVETGVAAGVVLVVWAFLYLWVGTALTGRTVGKYVTGLKVVDRSGSPLRGRQALGRTLLYPVSFVPFGLGLLGVVVSPERRTLHDVGAGTAVVYDWGNRAADMPAPLTAWLARHDVGPDAD